MKVFLGGTCNNSTWRDIIIPLLTIDYFNPIVPDWTPECQAEELHQRAVCDYCLYTITPKMTGVYSIAEVVDDSNKHPEKTLLVLLEKDPPESFTNGQWKSLQAVANMVRNNNSTVFTNLVDAASFLNSTHLRI